MLFVVRCSLCVVVVFCGLLVVAASCYLLVVCRLSVYRLLFVSYVCLLAVAVVLVVV